MTGCDLSPSQVVASRRDPPARDITARPHIASSPPFEAEFPLATQDHTCTTTSTTTPESRNQLRAPLHAGSKSCHLARWCCEELTRRRARSVLSLDALSLLSDVISSIQILSLSCYPLSGDGVKFEPLQVLGSYVWPTVGAYEPTCHLRDTWRRSFLMSEVPLYWQPTRSHTS